jgi:hypothetical protein
MNSTPHEKEEDLSPVSPSLSPTGDLSADPLSVHPRRNTLRKLSLTHHNGQVCLLRINAPSTRTPILNRLPLSPEQSHPVFLQQRISHVLIKPLFWKTHTYPNRYMSKPKQSTNQKQTQKATHNPKTSNRKRPIMPANSGSPMSISTKLRPKSTFDSSLLAKQTKITQTVRLKGFTRVPQRKI